MTSTTISIQKVYTIKIKTGLNLVLCIILNLLKFRHMSQKWSTDPDSCPKNISTKTFFFFLIFNFYLIGTKTFWLIGAFGDIEEGQGE